MMSNSSNDNAEKNTKKVSSKRSGIRKNHKDVFVTRLRMLLDDPNITTVSWHPSGKAVMVDKRYIDDQVNTLFPECFGNDKFTSIRQNLGAHGFKSACKRQKENDGIWKKYNHILSSSRFLHIYEHEIFRRDKPEKDKLIKRILVQRKPRVRNVLYSKQNTSTHKEGAKDAVNKAEDRVDDDSAEDPEPETARLNSDDRRPRRSEKLRWKFYSAIDEDYKVSQEQESDESQTPIAEDHELSAEVLDGVPCKSIDSGPVTINPVPDLVSPVLEDLRDAETYPVTDATDSDDWKRDNSRVQPEIQSSSIWKPMTSPLGDPNTQLTATLHDELKDAPKRYNNPVDLTTREKIKTPVHKRPVKSKSKPKPPVPVVNYVPNPVKQNQTWSDDDMLDEETCSTLAAFCQAKVSALYRGMILDEGPEQEQNNIDNVADITTDTKPEQKIEPKLHKLAANLPNLMKPALAHMIQIMPPPHKKIRLAKPNKVKINLSMPLCSPMEPTAVPNRINEHSALPNNLQFVNGHTALQNNSQFVNEHTALPNNPHLVNGHTVLPNNPHLVNGHTVLPNNSQFVNEHTVLPNNPQSVMASPAEEGELGTKSVPNNEAELIQFTTEEIKVGLSSVFSDTQKTSNPPFLLLPPTSIEENEEFGETTDVPMDTDLAVTQTLSEINLVPVAYARPFQSTGEEIKPVQMPQVHPVDTSIVLSPFQQLSKTESRVVADVQDKVSSQTISTGAQPIQKLPSIDQIFKPLPTTSVVATPTVAANVEVSSLSVQGRLYKNSAQRSQSSRNLSGRNMASTQRQSLPAGCTANRKSTGNKQMPSKPKAVFPSEEQKKHPAPNMPPYMYPYTPTGPGYTRWPGQYPWPPYMSMPGRYPPYYPCPLPNYNAYSHCK